MEEIIAWEVARARVQLAQLSAEKQDLVKRDTDMSEPSHLVRSLAWAKGTEEGLLHPADSEAIGLALAEKWTPENGGWAEDGDLATRVVVSIYLRKAMERMLSEPERW